MRYLVALVLVAGAIGWALAQSGPDQQVASAGDVPRQLSQLSR